MSKNLTTSEIDHSLDSPTMASETARSGSNDIADQSEEVLAQSNFDPVQFPRRNAPGAEARAVAT